MQHQDDVQPEKKRSSEAKVSRNEFRKLQRENARLKLRLKKTEGMIELQKKALELLEDLNPDDESNANNS